jgi:hypothetical protein
MLSKTIQMKYIKLLVLLFISNFVSGQIKLIDPLITESVTVFPKKKRTYNEFNGNYAIKYGFRLAEGWRRDSCNGGYGKEMGDNPYIDFIECQFIKTDYGSNFVYFYYKSGKSYSGRIKEKFNLLGSQQEIIFRGRCRNGKLQGKGTLTISETKEIVAECFFENGELVGISKSWDYKLNTETRTIYVKGKTNPSSSTKIEISPNK